MLSLKAAVSTDYFFPIREYLEDLETEDNPKQKERRLIL